MLGKNFKLLFIILLVALINAIILCKNNNGIIITVSNKSFKKILHLWVIKCILVRSMFSNWYQLKTTLHEFSYFNYPS